MERDEPGATQVGAVPVASGMGDPRAPVVIEEFTDFQCGYCASHALNTLPRIKEAYVDAGLVYYVVRDFPLGFHANAQLAASAARCAGAQDQYWPMHELLFAHQSDWSSLPKDEALIMFEKFADMIGIDRGTFTTCVVAGELQNEIDQDLLAGTRTGVQGTPSFLIDGELVIGAYPFETFEEKIEAALKRQN